MKNMMNISWYVKPGPSSNLRR